jgi:dTDP-4-dehydrorhamnose 3,5-epimerase-like enzyme
MVLDIRKNSPTFGNIILYDMPSECDRDYSEWIWVPPGFAHGNFFPEETLIEYFCSGQYSPNCEASISPLAQDLDWSSADPELKSLFDQLTRSSALMTDKDRNGLSVKGWSEDKRSDLFVYGAPMK